MAGCRARHLIGYQESDEGRIMANITSRQREGIGPFCSKKGLPESSAGSKWTRLLRPNQT